MNPHQHERKKRKLKKKKEDMIKLHNYEFPTERKARIESILFTDDWDKSNCILVYGVVSQRWM